MDQSYRRTITDIHVTDTSYTMTTYYMDTMEVLDTFTINKIDTDKSGLQELADKVSGLKEEDFTADEWNALQSALSEAQTVLADENATQEAINEAYAALQNAYDAAMAEEPGTGNEDPADEQKPSQDDDEVDTAAVGTSAAVAGLLVLGAAGVMVATRKRKA
mgnify:FL=1